MLHYPEHLGSLAQGLASMGDVAAAATIVDETLARADRHGAHWYVAEYLRIKGEVILSGRRKPVPVRGRGLLLPWPHDRE
jgi:hypothetical protein